MFDRLFILRRAIVIIISDRECFNIRTAKKLEIFEDDWDKCEVLVKLLKSLQLATIILFYNQQITIYMVRPHIVSLIVKHLNINQTNCMFSTNLKNNVSKNLAKRFSMQGGSPEKIPLIVSQMTNVYPT
uniref:Uncharacterized protein n=1 Tax=Sipha flava TaxID=143950 RepID=A0A2S2QEI5_9HEMI